MSRDPLTELDDVLLILGATMPAELNVMESPRKVPHYEYTARRADRPGMTLPISTAIARALLSQGAVLETSVTLLEAGV
jgi:hypothetical protein